ncbi:MAG: DUF1294 domain-containing protein [Alphaproteobacteria bacterium]
MTQSNIPLILVVFLFTVNVTAFFAFKADKNAARRGNRRTPESTLLLLAMVGGTIGCISAQHIFRHKTRKQPFKFELYSIAVVQVIFLISMLFPDNRHYVTEFLSNLYESIGQ